MNSVKVAIAWSKQVRGEEKNVCEHGVAARPPELFVLNYPARAPPTLWGEEARDDEKYDHSWRRPHRAG